ncbi:MAG: vWA domain-containing protein [Thermoflexales bacterium]
MSSAPQTFDPADPQIRSGHLLHNLILFGRVLRGLGLDVNPGRMIDLVNALALIQIGRKQDFFFVAQSLLVQRREDLALFKDAFDFFWVDPRDRVIARGRRQGETPFTRPKFAPPPLNPSVASPADGAPDAGERTLVETTYSPSDREALRRKDFSQLTAEEMRAIKAMMDNLLWRPGERRTRRLVAGHGDALDLRRTLRRNIAHGGELVRFAERGPKVKPRPLVIIADVSGSMERYTRLLLHFVYSLSAGLRQQVETFVFSTRLTRITRPLRQRSVDRALRDVSRAVTDWSGGTRIGEALKTFNYRWARRVMRSSAVALIISDGWDRGDPDLLRREMARLRRSCRRVIWLNPLLGGTDYQPLARGMQAALPYIDDFLPVHNLASLEDLADRLARLK